MFLKKITAIYLILSLLEFLIITCQVAEETNSDDSATYVETPNFNNLNPMSTDMSDPIIKELTKHYAELLSKSQQNSNDNDDDNNDGDINNNNNNDNQEQQNKSISEENNKTDIDNITDTLTKQMTATETPLQQQPIKIDIPSQLDELNETDDIETNKKFLITTLIPDLLMQLRQEQNSSSITEVLEKLNINPTAISSSPLSSVSSSMENSKENTMIETNENETEIAGENNYGKYYNEDTDTDTDTDDRNYGIVADGENIDDNDSESSSSTLLVSAEINDTSEMANEMKQNIFYTDEIDENNLLKVYNHSNDFTEGLLSDLQSKTIQELPLQEALHQENIAFTSDTALSGSGININNGNTVENETIVITTTIGTPTIIQNTQQRVKKPKKINSDEKPKRPYEKLRDFIEDPYSRNPIAAIIDPSENVLERARVLWKNALRPNTELDIILLALVNRTALPLIYHLNNTRTFLAGLNSMKESTDSDPFSGVLKATELIPYDSAVFICAETVEPNPELANYAGILLLKKRIKLYLIWFGDRKSKDTNEPVGGMLGKIALRSGGEIIYMDDMNNIENSSNDLEDNMITLVSDRFSGSQEIDIPIDTTVSSIQMKIDSQMRTATLETPTGETINLKKFMQLKSKKFIGSTKIYYEINIPLEKNNNLDHLKLKLIPNILNTNYCLSIELEKPKMNKEEFLSKYGNEFDDMINYIKSSDQSIKKYRQGRLENNVFSHENIRFPYDNETILNPKDLEVETIDINTNETNEAQQIGGGIGSSSLFSITKIDLGVTSQLLVYPGMEAHIDYEVTNLREESVFHTIRVVDTKSYLRAVTPNSIFIRPGETLTVRLFLLIPPGAKIGTVDDITFTLEGQNQVTQSAQLKIISRDENQDRNPPYVTWSFGTRCENTYYNQRECNSKFWTLDVFAQDYETGLLRISSTPNGIIPRSPFTAGTTEPVRTVYTSSCCEPRVTIMVYDVAGNQRTYTIDVRDIVLTEASIAAIVLGVILLILLIGLLIGLIVWCCKRKRSRSRDLSFRSHPERVR
ncbi:uncharacterized protein LOC129605617 [Condylostylus longicornis]|uniref:uncharacterized protein LOC129605617 n=1 Tax=Condylostylus longicornis TaxID=2530218 RepID=UPI00244E0F8D|nr:uncharacterized protein LOC129605617 [Condylostylus longicornis]